MTVQHSPCEHQSEILDWDALKSRCLGRNDLVERILTGFRDRLTGELQQLEQAYEAQDESMLAAVAHRMAGTSLTVSANRLAESSRQLHDLALRDFSAIDGNLNGMRVEVCLLSDLITNWLSQGSS